MCSHQSIYTIQRESVNTSSLHSQSVYHAMSGLEVMSSKAAAFSIANLLNTGNVENSQQPEQQKSTLTGYTIRNLLHTQPDPRPLTPCTASTYTNSFDFVRSFDFTSSSLPRLPTREIQVALQQSDLWWKFYTCGTEMVITRTGR